MELNNTVIISGPSGAGEDSVIEGLRAYMPINRVITTSTREMRPGEKDGDPYYFISKEAFEVRLKNGEFIEWARQYNDQLYGVTADELKRVNDLPGVGVWKLEYKGVINAKKLFPNMLAILLMESLDILEKRIRSRTHVDEAYVEERMRYTKEWLEHVDIYDYTVVNHQGHLEEAIEEVVEILRKEGYPKETHG